MTYTRVSVFGSVVALALPRPWFYRGLGSTTALESQRSPRVSSSASAGP